MSVPRTLEELLADLRGKVIRLERRLNKTGGGGGGGGSPYVLPDRLGGPTGNIPDLGPGVDLNTIKAPGWYIQNTNVDATVALNYPLENRAGHLEVSGGDMGTGNDFTLQTYTEYAPPSGKPNRQWMRSQYGATWYPWQQVDPGATGAAVPLPAPIRYAPGTTHTVSATSSFTPLPGAAAQSMTVSKACWVLVTFGAWVQTTAGETRFGVALTGATVVDPPNYQQGGVVGSGAWGQTGYLGAQDANGSGSGQRTIQRLFRLEPGTTTFTIEAYMATAGTHSVNYPTMEVIPLYFDGVGGSTTADDTGWVDLTPYLTGGFTASAGNVDGRIIGGTDCEIRGSMNAPTLAASSSGVDFLTDLPVEFRPTKRIGFGTALNSGYVMTAYIRPAGTGAISLRDGLSGSTQFSIKYFLG